MLRLRLEIRLVSGKRSRWGSSVRQVVEVLAWLILRILFRPMRLLTPVIRVARWPMATEKSLALTPQF